MQHRMLLCNSIKNTSGSVRRELEYRKAIQLGEAKLYQPVCHLRVRVSSPAMIRAINDWLNHNNLWNGSWRRLTCFYRMPKNSVFFWHSFSGEESHHFTNGYNAGAAWICWKQPKASPHFFTAKHNALRHKSVAYAHTFLDISSRLQKSTSVLQIRQHSSLDDKTISNN